MSIIIVQFITKFQKQFSKRPNYLTTFRVSQISLADRYYNNESSQSPCGHSSRLDGKDMVVYGCVNIVIDSDMPQNAPATQIFIKNDKGVGV